MGSETPGPTDGRAAGRASRLHGLCLGLLLLLGVSLRVLGAWALALTPSSDRGIVALMSKHVAEGREWPVFYYGQPYMGSLESLVGGLFCRLFGVSGFAANLGTALFGCLLLPLAYLWGRRAAGPAGGLAALLLCAVGPTDYAAFMSRGYGGYASNAAFVAALVLLALEIEARVRQAKPVAARSFGWLGLLAGLAWWTNQMILPALACCAVLAAPWRRRFWAGGRPLLALPGFALGSLPLWVWNARNDWATFRHLADSAGGGAFAPSLWRWLAQRLPETYNLPSSWTTGVVAAALTTAFAAGIWRTWRREGGGTAGRHQLAALIVVVGYLGVLAHSCPPDVTPTRYLVAFAAPLAVMAASLVARAVRRPWRLAAWAAVTGLTLWFGADLWRHLAAHRRDDEANLGRARTLAAYLRGKSLSHVFAAYPRIHALNFLLREEFVFTSLQEKYPPYRTAVEMTERPAVLNGNDRVDAFLAATAGSASSTGLAGFVVHYDFRPPAGGLRAIAFARTSPAETNDAGRAAAALGDRREDTAVRLTRREDREASVDLRLAASEGVTALRLFCAEGWPPASVRVAARERGGDTWREVLDAPVTPYFWSGPRPFWGRPFERIECRFGPVTTDVLRVTFVKPPGGRPCSITEAYAFGPANGAAVTNWPVAELATTLRSRGVEYVYADRWLSTRLPPASGGAIRIAMPPLGGSRRAGVPRVTWAPEPKSATVVDTEDASGCLAVLASCGLFPRETQVGPWTVLDFENETLWRGAPSLLWTGRGLLLTADGARARPEFLALQAALLASRGQASRARDCLALAARAEDPSRTALESLARATEALGDAAESARWRQRADESWTPRTPLDMRFDCGVRLVGVTVLPAASRGEAAIRYFWERERLEAGKGLAVFVHAMDGDRLVAQDDHDLPAAAWDGWKGRWPAASTRVLKTPRLAEKRRLRLLVGLYDPKTGKRIRVTGAAKTVKDAVEIPVARE